MKLALTISGTPVTKKNSQRILRSPRGRPFIAPSAKYEQYEESAGWQLTHKGDCIDRRVNVRCVYYMPTKRRVDLCNLLEATCDILTKYKILTDDCSSVVASHDGSCVRYDKENPRVEITIEECGM